MTTVCVYLKASFLSKRLASSPSPPPLDFPIFRQPDMEFNGLYRFERGRLKEPFLWRFIATGPGYMRTCSLKLNDERNSIHKSYTWPSIRSAYKWNFKLDKNCDFLFTVYSVFPENECKYWYWFLFIFLWKECLTCLFSRHLPKKLKTRDKNSCAVIPVRR